MATSTIKGGYWLSDRADQFPPSRISTSDFTHLFYASVKPDPNKLDITPLDERWMPIFTDAVHKRPELKALLSIGGRNDCPPSTNHPSSGILSEMARIRENRDSFIYDSIAKARNFGFDGLDLDWEYPNTQEDMENLALLLQEWRAAIEAESDESGKPKLLLSAAVYFESIITIGGSPRSYPIEAINSFVDFVGPRCYDYHGSWDTVTGIHSCLRDPNHPHVNTEYGITAWLNASLCPQKLVMGLPLYGRTWTLADPREHGVGAPAVGVGTGRDGIKYYHEIVQFNAEHNAQPYYDQQTVWLYSWAGTDWIGYDDKNTIRKKVEFARNKNIGGYFLWALGYDSNDSLTKAASEAWIGNGTAH